MPRQNKIDKLIEASEAMQEIEAIDAKTLSFMARILVQATLPHRDPGDVPAWGRQNGTESITIQPGIIWEDGKPKTMGLPFGTIPRLLMIWITTQAVKTKSREIILGDTLSEFMEKLEMVPTGGRWGTITRLKEQMHRLFSARIIYQNTSPQHHIAKETSISKERVLWWDESMPKQASLFESYILLDEDFYEIIAERPIPVDLRAVSALKKSPLALDIYIWLTYRMSYLEKNTAIPWTSLQKQFGSDYKQTKNFILKVREALNKILVLHPELKVSESKGELILKPSPLAIKGR